MIEIKNISFSFGNNKIISDFSLGIEEGKTYCIMGKSGVGKTTLMKLIAGLLKPDKGEILGTEKLKKSFVFQENRLLPGLSVYENIKFVTADEEKITNALQDTSLLSEKNKMIDELSGGMARRVAIARATAFNGDIFFIDEPLYGLDVETSQDILELIKNTIKNKTALIITHSPEEAFYLSDKIIFLKTIPVCEAETVDTAIFGSTDEIKTHLLA